MRRTGTIAAVITAAALAGCSAGSPAHTASRVPGQASPAQTATSGVSHSFGDRYTQAPGLLTQCGITHGTIKAPTGQPWYRDGKVLPLSGSDSGQNDAEQSSWWDMEEGTVIGGKSLLNWSEWAASNDRLPPAVCGNGASATILAARIFPGQSDPWG